MQLKCWVQAHRSFQLQQLHSAKNKTKHINQLHTTIPQPQVTVALLHSRLFLLFGFPLATFFGIASVRVSSELSLLEGGVKNYRPLIRQREASLVKLLSIATRPPGRAPGSEANFHSGQTVVLQCHQMPLGPERLSLTWGKSRL